MQSPLDFWKSQSLNSKRFLLICLVLSFVMHAITAIYSYGFYLFDEHYQIIEFAWMKLGHSNLKNMAWEYQSMSRPTLQPWIAIVIFKVLGMTNPFKMAFVLRLITSILGFASLIPFCLLGMQWNKNELLRKVFPFLLATLPIIAFVHARFSSEGFGCIFLLWGICFLLISYTLEIKNKSAKVYMYLFLAGASFAVAFVCRIQIALAFPGIFIWAYFIDKLQFKKIVIIGVAMLFVILLSAILDRLYYGIWVNSLWLYFKINFIDGKANSFGKLPFFFYFKEIISKLGFIWGWLFILTMLIGWIRKPLNIFTLAFVPYFIFHCFFGHKEIRFLFPMVCIIPLFIVFAFDGIKNFNFNSLPKGVKIAGWLMLIFYIFSDIVWISDTCFSPARIEFYAYKYLDEYRNVPLTIVSLYDEEWPYGPDDHMNMDFYKQRNLITKYHKPDETQLRQIADTSKFPVYLYCTANEVTPPSVLLKSGVPYFLEYKSLPDWVLTIKSWHIIDLQPVVLVYRVGGKSI